MIPSGSLSAVGIGNSVIGAAGVIRPILLAPLSVNQRLPSGPAVIPYGSLSAVGMANSVTTARRGDPPDLVAARAR